MIFSPNYGLALYLFRQYIIKKLNRADRCNW